jgi:hypothetical protein
VTEKPRAPDGGQLVELLAYFDKSLLKDWRVLLPGRQHFHPLVALHAFRVFACVRVLNSELDSIVQKVTTYTNFFFSQRPLLSHHHF